MGALAGRGGRHRPWLAGAAGLILALAAPAAAHAGPTLVTWEVSGGLIGGQGPAVQILKDRTIRATDDGGTDVARITRREMTRLRDRLEASRFRSLKAEYKPEVIVFDGTVESVRHKGHTVSVTTGAEIPRRLDRLLNTLSRLYGKYAAPS
jgi:hypothetical protein